jgi:hypothetical protein
MKRPTCSPSSDSSRLSNPSYHNKALIDEGQSKFEGYVGSLTVETEYTLDG